MSKLPIYPEIQGFEEGDILIVDGGTGGTRKITAQNAAKEIVRLSENGILNLDGIKHKAEIDGLYEMMTAGNAEQLVSTVYVEDSAPYLYRTSGGSKDIGDREYLEIVGGSVGWNQLCSKTDKITIESGGGSTNTKIQDITAVAGHKYLLMITQENSMASNTRNTLMFSCNGEWQYEPNASWGNTGLTAGTRGMIANGNANALASIYIWTHTLSDTTTYSNFMIIDLTLLLGSTIADYIYTLETAEAGAGVAKLKSWGFFTKDYYPYDAGSLKSVEGLESHDTVGFNQWDEEWETGLISVSSGASLNGNGIRAKNYNPCVGNTDYYLKLASNLYIFWYDSSKNYINYNYRESSGIVPSPANACYFRIRIDGISTYNHDICINLSWSGYRNGEYEPYVKHSYPLDSSITLRGIPKKDADGNLYFDGDVYSSDGTVQRRYNVVDLGSLTWRYISERFRASLSNVKIPAANIAPNALSVMYLSYPATTDFSTLDRGMTIVTGESDNLVIRNVEYTDTESFKTAMSGVYLVYELATPTTETAEPFQSPQIVDDFGTEQFVTDSVVPVGHNTKYPANLRDKLQHLFSLADENGTYIIVQNGTQMSPVRLPGAAAELPDPPTVDGTYTLTCTIDEDGEEVYSWEAD